METLEQVQLIKQTAEKLNLPEEQVKLVVNNFWKAVKYYITNIELAKHGILINEFFKIRVRFKHVAKQAFRTDYKLKNYPQEFWKNLYEKSKTYGVKKDKT